MSETAYNFKLSLFEGPLDLLLHLIQKAQVDIKDIFVSEITSQYLEAVALMDELPMDSASEFAAMAATLLYIKSRSLLPRPKPEPEEDEEDPEEALLRKLREYKACKEAAEKLYTLEADAFGSFTKPPEEFPLPPRSIEALGGSVEELFQAFSALLKTRRSAPAAGEVRRDAYTLAAAADKLRQTLRRKPILRFKELFARNYSREECVVTFMALLELIALGEISVEQRAVFDDIWIRRAAKVQAI